MSFRARICMVRTLLLFLVSVAVGVDAIVDCENYGVMGDAGSTGTRLYAMYDITTDSPKVHVVGKQKGGLAVIGPDEAFKEGLGDLLTKSHEHLKSVGCSVETQQGKLPKLAIFGTAGTRLLAPAKRQKMWDDLRTRILNHMDTNNLKFEVLGLQTITGSMEGFSAFLSVNFLKRHVNHNLLLQQDLYGVVDLGGASTQIAVPRDTEKNKTLKMGHSFIRSFLGFGTKEFLKHLSDNDKASCVFSTDAREDASAKCRQVLTRQFDFYIVDGPSYDVKGEPTRIGKEDLEIIRSANVKTVYGISGFYFAAKFVVWLEVLRDSTGKLVTLEKLSTTPLKVADFRAAADRTCRTSVEELKRKFKSHPEEEAHKIDHTAEEQLPERCFDVSYMVTLLEEIYQWKNVDLFLSQEVEGNSVDWPLGAYVMATHDKAWLSQTENQETSMSMSNSKLFNGSGAFTDSPDTWYWMQNCMAALAALCVFYFLYRKYQSTGFSIVQSTTELPNVEQKKIVGRNYPDSVPILTKESNSTAGTGSDDNLFPGSNQRKVVSV